MKIRFIVLALFALCLSSAHALEDIFKDTGYNVTTYRIVDTVYKATPRLSGSPFTQEKAQNTKTRLFLLKLLTVEKEKMLAYAQKHKVLHQKVLEAFTDECKRFRQAYVDQSDIPNLLIANNVMTKEYYDQAPNPDAPLLATLIKQSFTDKTDAEAQSLAEKIIAGVPVTTNLPPTRSEQIKVKVNAEFFPIFALGATSLVTATVYMIYVTNEYETYLTSWEKLSQEEKVKNPKKSFSQFMWERLSKKFHVTTLLPAVSLVTGSIAAYSLYAAMKRTSDSLRR